MTGAPPALPGVTCEQRDLECYADMFTSRAQVCEPSTREELRAIFAAAREEGRRVTLRAGGHAFDEQALGDDVVVAMTKFRGVEDEGDDSITVGAGTTWGEIVEHLQQQGKAPFVTVTTAHATAGGTLASDCLSRCSPVCGKEGRHVLRFDLMTPDGEVHQCTPPGSDGPPSRDEQLFRGAVGGFGYLGAILSITYRVRPIRSAGDTRPLGVHTTLRTFGTFAEFAGSLVPATRAMRLDPPDGDEPDAIYGALYVGKRQTPRAVTMQSRFTSQVGDCKPMLLFQKPGIPRILVEWLIRFRWFNGVLWWATFKWFYKTGNEYDNELPSFTFFMDGNAKAKRLARRIGLHARTLQQTFVVPAGNLEDDPRESQARLVAWLNHAQAVLRKHDLIPTFYDVLYLPQDSTAMLSATAGGGGFAVSYAFEAPRPNLDHVEPVFAQLTDDLWKDHGGRVSLVKNVCAAPAVLVASYGTDLEDFLALKQSVDRDGVLRNHFFDKTIATAAGVPPVATPTP
jgi:decaprenylphospho-beta-D-ribofuranose 2-oxidase